jgi:hypothetical protein
MQHVHLQHAIRIVIKVYPRSIGPPLEVGDVINISSDNGRNCCPFKIEEIKDRTDHLVVTAKKGEIGSGQRQRHPIAPRSR